jgi:hypothetical protein
MKILFLALLMLLPLDADAGALPPDSVLQTGSAFTDQGWEPIPRVVQKAASNRI